MKKLIQFRAARAAPLSELIEFHLGRLFPRHPVFAKEASQKPVACYLAEKKVPKTFGIVKEKTMITLVVRTKSPNLANGEIRPEQIIFNEDGIIVVNKPSGLATQPTLLATDDCLYHQLILGELMRHNYPARLPYFGLHHRLDRDTSGLVVLTTKPSKNKMAADWFQYRQIKKTYLAVVKGELSEQQWTMKKNIKRKIHERHKFYFIATEVGGNRAESRFKCLESLLDEYHLLQAIPITGRTHQLRVHLKASGLKIIGDRLYGAEAKNLPMRLHAWKMEIPWRGEKKQFTCLPPWPELKRCRTTFAGHTA